MNTANQVSEKQQVSEQLRVNRLPAEIRPTFYDICIEPDLKQFTFSGKEEILLQVFEPARQIVLNCAEIKIEEAVLFDDSGTSMNGTVTHDESTEKAAIIFDGEVGSGYWHLLLRFTGTINDKLKGFYRSVYKTADGAEEVIATTKFEPCDARRAFPCWDEPAYKARFKITLVIPSDFQAISNAAMIKQEELGNGNKRVEFAPSIVMSTYLVAYVIGKLEASDPVYADLGEAGKKEIRVWAVPGKKHLTGFALAAARFSLEYFAAYFEQPYPCEKLDLVAIPDFASGAMENFACITFREALLLVDEKTASHANLERIAEVVMHENAHMWFGDFTTMSWWNGLWLNEAFATFMAAKAADAWKPEWRVWDGFNIQRAVAMRVDGLLSTRPIEFPVGNPEEARAMFDVLTYQKGCAVLRMLELFLGEERFRKGIALYIRTHAFANADTPDLWSALEKATRENVESVIQADSVSVTELMNSWVYQPGYPVITVEQSNVTGAVTFTQNIFRYLPDDETPDNNVTESEHTGTGSKNNAATLWHIPLHIRATVSGGSGQRSTVEKVILLSQKSQTFYLGENLSSLVVNAGGHGFYRVRYSDSLRQSMLDNSSMLTIGERFNFIADMWADVQSQKLSCKDYLLSTGALICACRETDVNVFNVILGSMNTLRRILPEEEPVQSGLLNLVRSFCVPVLDRIDWFTAQSGETPQQGQLRGSLLSMLGTLGDTTVRQWAATEFVRYQTDRQSVDTNLIGAMVDTLATGDDSDTYDKFLALHTNATTPQDEQRFLFALAQFNAKELVERTLKMCIDGSVRTQDAPYLVRNTMMNHGSGQQAWRFMVDNWQYMTDRYPMSSLGRMCEGVTALVSPELEADVRRFFACHQVKGGEKAIKQYLEQLHIAVRLMRSERSLLRDLLMSVYQNGIE